MIALVVVSVLLLLAVSIVAALVASFRFPADAASFPCKLRPAGPGDEGRRWPRRRCRGTWVHDVLLVRRGLVFARLDALPVRTPQDAPRAAGSELRGLGDRPVAVVLRLDDATLVELAAPRSALGLVVGPFLAAAVPGFPRGPRGPRDNRNIGR